MNIDLNDLDVWQQGVPHEQFKWLRENDPVYFQSQPDGPGYWCLTKHEDIVKASKNFHGFSSAKGMHITDPINGRILAVSEDKIAGFLPDPLDEIARLSGIDLDTVIERIAAIGPARAWPPVLSP